MTLILLFHISKLNIIAKSIGIDTNWTEEMHVEVVEEDKGRQKSYVVYSAANAWVCAWFGEYDLTWEDLIYKRTYSIYNRFNLFLISL